MTSASDIIWLTIADLAFSFTLQKPRPLFLVDAAQTAGAMPDGGGCSEALRSMCTLLYRAQGAAGPWGALLGRLYVQTRVQVAPLWWAAAGPQHTVNATPTGKCPHFPRSQELNVPRIARLGAGVRYFKRLGRGSAEQKKMRLHACLQKLSGKFRCAALW